MGLLEDLNSGKYNLVLFGIIFVFIFYQFWCKKTEPMADVSSLTEDKIRELIYKTYLIDVNSIKNLADIAKEILNEKPVLTIPAGITVKGKIISGGEISNNSFSISELDAKLSQFYKVGEELNKKVKDLELNTAYLRGDWQKYNEKNLGWGILPSNLERLCKYNNEPGCWHCDYDERYMPRNCWCCGP